MRYIDPGEAFLVKRNADVYPSSSIPRSITAVCGDGSCPYHKHGRNFQSGLTSHAIPTVTESFGPDWLPVNEDHCFQQPSRGI